MICNPFKDRLVALVSLSLSPTRKFRQTIFDSIVCMIGCADEFDLLLSTHYSRQIHSRSNVSTEQEPSDLDAVITTSGLGCLKMDQKVEEIGKPIASQTSEQAEIGDGAPQDYNVSMRELSGCHFVY